MPFRPLFSHPPKLPSHPVILVVGATSLIARELCRRFAARGWRIVLAGRRGDALEEIAADLRVRWPIEVTTLVLSPQDPGAADECVARANAAVAGGIDGVVVCHGKLIQEEDRFLSPREIRDLIDVNFTTAAVILGTAAAHLEQRGGGFLAAISSVAGDRGRQSNYNYGAAKAGLTAYLSGLRNRLAVKGIPVLTIKPGFVATPMIAGTPAEDSVLTATPRRVADDIDRAILRGADILYTPWYWRPILLIIRALPEAVFKRLRM